MIFCIRAEEWDPKRAYYTGDVAEYDKKLYMCVDNQYEEEPIDPRRSKYWRMAVDAISEEGEHIRTKTWFRHVSYDQYECVLHKGRLYVCVVKDSREKEPGLSSHWVALDDVRINGRDTHFPEWAQTDYIEYAERWKPEKVYDRSSVVNCDGVTYVCRTRRAYCKPCAENAVMQDSALKKATPDEELVCQEYNPGVKHIQGEWVGFDGDFYIAKVNVPVGVYPTLGTLWEKVEHDDAIAMRTWKEWDPRRKYVKGSRVTFKGGRYRLMLSVNAGVSPWAETSSGKAIWQKF